jgi:hypothetical protein
LHRPEYQQDYSFLPPFLFKNSHHDKRFYFARKFNINPEYNTSKIYLKQKIAESSQLDTNPILYMIPRKPEILNDSQKVECKPPFLPF